jgi:hypothetical protein
VSRKYDLQQKLKDALDLGQTAPKINISALACTRSLEARFLRKWSDSHARENSHKGTEYETAN